MAYDLAKVTANGNNLIAQILANKSSLSIDKIEISDTQLSSTTDISTMTSVPKVVQTVSANGFSKNSNTLIISTVVDNSSISADYRAWVFGIWGSDSQNGQSQLIAVITSTNSPDTIPAFSGSTPVSYTYKFNIGFSNASQIQFNMIDDAFATNDTVVHTTGDETIDGQKKFDTDPTDSAGNAYAKTIDVNQQLDKKVNIADMRKPANQVASIDEVNAKQDKIGYTPADDSKVVHDNHDGSVEINQNQIEPVNVLTDSVGGRNLLPVSNYNPGYVNGADGSISPANATIKEVISNFIPVDITQSYYCQVIQQVNANQAWYAIGFYDANEQFISRFSTGNTTVTGTIMSVTRMLPFGSPNISIPNVTTTAFPKNTAYVRVSFRTYGAPIQASLEKTSILNDWTPAPEDKVNVADMRKPASDVAGIEEVNTKADDSKVAHLSGANNFDTVPTVNNNPLLLASSLPSDLARLSQNANFTAKLQQNGQDVALANNTLARNPNTGKATDAIDFDPGKLTIGGNPAFSIVMCTNEADAKSKSAADPHTLYVYPKES